MEQKVEVSSMSRGHAVTLGSKLTEALAQPPCKQDLPIHSMDSHKVLDS